VIHRIYVEHWQMQCCGAPFSVGSTIEWNVHAVADREYLAAVLGEDEAGRVTDAEDHHDVDERPSHLARGVVRSIDAVFCEYAPRTAGSRELFVVPGTGVLEPRETADGWEGREKVGAGRKFIGYLVNVDGAPREREV